MMESIKDRVDRGEALLDERYPGWRKKINIESLHMKSTCNCILGQIFEDFLCGLDEMSIEGPNDYETGYHKPDYYGFDAMDGMSAEEFEALQAEWEKRLVAPVGPTKRDLQPA